jgi:hypothetical protein
MLLRQPSSLIVSAVRHHHAVTLQEAVQASPTLGRLAALCRESSDQLQAVLPLIPPAMRAAVQAGPIEGETWFLLVHGANSAAKLRQLLPLMRLRLAERGWGEVTIQIKVLAKSAP